jgi:hypothetical protein
MLPAAGKPNAWSERFSTKCDDHDASTWPLSTSRDTYRAEPTVVACRRAAARRLKCQQQRSRFGRTRPLPADERAALHHRQAAQELEWQELFKVQRRAARKLERQQHEAGSSASALETTTDVTSIVSGGQCASKVSSSTLAAGARGGALDCLDQDRCCVFGKHSIMISPIDLQQPRPPPLPLAHGSNVAPLLPALRDQAAIESARPSPVERLGRLLQLGGR